MLDHLIWGARDLEHAVEEIAERTGVRPAPGGSHPGLGTRNALVSLDEWRYLEIIAPDPAQGNVPGLAAQLAELERPRLISWVARVESMDEVVAWGKDNGYPVSKISESRLRPDGTELRWSFATVDKRGLLPHVPGFIEWGSTAHPSQDAPEGCRLLGYRIEAPQPEAVRALLNAFRLTVDVRVGPTERLSATLDTPNGQIEL